MDVIDAAIAEVGKKLAKEAKDRGIQITAAEASRIAQESGINLSPADITKAIKLADKAIDFGQKARDLYSDRNPDGTAKLSRLSDAETSALGLATSITGKGASGVSSGPLWFLKWEIASLLPDFENKFNDFMKQLRNKIPFASDPFNAARRDPIVLDLDGDGVELTSLAGSNVNFDYAGDGFAERTGWVSADDGILAIDLNGDGKIGNGLELFGSPTQDGFAVLEKLDTNADGKIDALDADFNKLVIWRDLNQNGVSDAGELQSLSVAGITSISLNTQKLDGTNAGNSVGYGAAFTRTDATAGLAETIYFDTDVQDSVVTPSTTPSNDALEVPQLPGSGFISSIAYKATDDPVFLADWAALTDAAPGLTQAELKSQFEQLLLRWAGVDDVDPISRGAAIDARHLAFLEKFYGTAFVNNWDGHDNGIPNQHQGQTLESAFDNIVSGYLTLFLAQSAGSSLVRGTGDVIDMLDNPYFWYSQLDFSDYALGDPDAPTTPGNIDIVISQLVAMAPENPGGQASYLVKGLGGLSGVISSFFANDQAAYAAVVAPLIDDGVVDATNRAIAMGIVNGAALFGTTSAEGINGTSAQDVFIGGGGGDLLSGGNGSDIYVYNKQDGDLWIRDEGAATDTDRLVLTDLNSTDLTFDRIGDDLLMRITATGKTVVIDSFFANQGVDVLRFADGTEWDRSQIANASVFRGDGHNNVISDSGGHDVIRGGKGDDYIRISGGSDTILYSKGDGYDIVHDTLGQVSEHDTFVLTDLNANDIQLSRVGLHLVLTVKSTGEYVDFDNFFPSNGGESQTKNIDAIKFADGTSWDRAQIMQQAWVRGTDGMDTLATGSDLNDTIYGGKGDDFLQGWNGSDTYVWKKGDGNDEIYDFSSKIGNPNNTDIDTLWLQDVSAGEVSYSYQGSTLLITINTTGEIIRVDEFFSGVNSLLDGNAGYWLGIDQIKFQDGSVIDRAQITYNAGRDYLGWDPVVVTMVEQGLIIWQTYWDEFGHEGNIVAGASPGIDDIWNASSYGGLGGTLGIPDALQPNPFHGGGNNRLNGSGRVDIMAGGLGADVLDGLGGDDVLYGDEVGSDTVGGNDVLLGGGGNDVLYGGGGSDYLDGWVGSDFISGGDGKDYILANDGDDIIIGGKGDDVIYNNNGAGSGNDTYIYAKGDGNDLIVEGNSPGTDVLILTDINSYDVELSQSLDDLLIKIKATGEVITVAGHFIGLNAPGAGLEYIRFADVQWGREQIQQASWIRGTDGRDVLDGTQTLSSHFLGQTFQGGKGDDIIYSGYQSGSGSDTFVYARGDGNDTISEQTWRSFGPTETDVLKFTDISSSDVQLTRSGDDLLIKIISTNETITVLGQFGETPDAPGMGIETIQFANGDVWNRAVIQQNAWFRGTDGRDLIDARISRWDDTIEAGKGDDIIYTGLQSVSGNDTFIYSKGDGNDTIYENTWRSFTSTETDVLLLKDIEASEVNLTRSGDNLLVHILPTNETITIVGQFGDATDTPDSGIEYIRFANGDQWGRSTIYGLATSNSPFLVGTRGNDVLIGSTANQNLYGEAGDDRIDGQGGNDLLYGGLGNDTLVLSVSAPGDVATINGGVGTDTLDLSGFGSAVWVDLVTNGAEVRTTDQSDLASGTWRDMGQVEQIENIVGTAFSDQIAGDAGNNVIVGGAGNDVIDARSGDDVVSGGSGDDTLTGGMGKDKLDGGIGADILNGGLDSDILIGGADNDVLTGGTGGDIFVVGVGDGSDTVTDFTAGNGTDHDMVRFDRTMFADFASVMAAASQVGSDVVISLGNGDSLTLQNVDLAALTADNFEFRRLGNEAPTAIAVTGGSVQENAVGGTVVATLAAVDAGDAGAHSFSIVAADDLFEIVGNQIRVKNGAVLDFETQPQHALTVKVVDDDGMSATSMIVIGITDQVETVAGTSGKDVLAGGAGSDILIGGAGADRISGGNGSDEYRYNLGDGNDRIVDSGGSADTDRLVLGSGIDPATIKVGRSSLDNSDIVLQLANGDTIVLQDQLSASAGAGIEQISFANGAVWSRSDLLGRLDSHLFIGGADTPALAGSGAADVFVAGSGAETLTGYGGSDTYRVGAGADSVVISEDAEDGTDRLELVGLNAADVTFIQRGADLVVKNKANGHITTITNQFSFAPTGVEQAVFADGTVWDKTQIAAHSVLPNAAGNYTIVGTSEDDTFQPGAGNDLIQGGAGSDTVIYALGDGSDTINDGYNSASQVDVLKLVDLRPGDVIFSRLGSDLSIAIPGSGDVITVQGQFTSTSDYWGVEQIRFSDGTVWDRSAIAAAAWIRGTGAAETLNGTSDADTLDAGAGADTLYGGDGGDTYIYHAGSGNDVVYETSTGSGTDVLKLVGLNSTDVTFTQSGNDLLMRVKSSNEVLTVKDQFDGTSGIERVVFANGTSWTRSELLYNLSGTGVVFFHPGDGQITLDASVGTVRMDPAIAPGDVLLQASGSDLIVRLRGTNDTITVRGDLLVNTWGVSSSLRQLIFSDGSVLEIGKPSSSEGQPITFTWLGNATNFNLTGSTYGSNVYETSVNGTVNFVNSSAVGGTNIVRYDRGDQNLVIWVNNNAGRYELGSGITAQDIYWQANQYGDLNLKIRGDSADSISAYGDLKIVNGVVVGSISNVKFSDGTLLDISHGPTAFTWLGNTANFTVTGTTFGTNVYEVTVGGHINFADASAVGGTNIVKFDKGAQNLAVQANNISGSIELGPQIAAQDVYWQSNGYGDLILKIRGDDADSINVWGDLRVTNGVVASAIKTVKFSDGTALDMSHGPTNFTWLGNTANFTVTGTTFGTNIYEVTAANGKINFADASAVGGTNIVKFDKGGLALNVQANNFSGELDLGSTISAQDVYWQTNGYGDLILKLRGDDADSINVWGDLHVTNGVVTSAIKNVKFSDGTVLDMSQGPSVFTWIGAANNYNLAGSNMRSNVFEITQGNGAIKFGNASGGGDGNNTIRYDLGDGLADVQLNGGKGVISFGSNVSVQDVTVGSNANGDLIVKFRNDTTDAITIHNDLVFANPSFYGISAIQFADGTTWDYTFIAANAWFRGTSGNESIYGSSFGDTILGDAGNDYLQGNDGSDTYIYRLGDGNDEIADRSGSATDIDTLKLADLNASDVTVSRSGNALRVTINSTGAAITVDDQFYSQTANWGVERLLFANGESWDLPTITANAWFRGTSGNESLYGSSLADTLIGGLGNDYLQGNDGSDTYIYRLGDGNDEIADRSGSVTDIDTLKLTDLNASDVTLSRSGNALRVTINATGAVITVDDQFYSQTANWGIEKLLFANGDSLDLPTIWTNAWFRGTSGNDSLSASSTADTLFGDLGNDYLQGNGGSDTYLYRSGDGNDEIADRSDSVTDIDTLKLTDLNASDVTLTRSGNALLVRVNATGAVITVDDQFYSQTANWGIEKLLFANGESWDLPTITTNAWIRGTAGNDSITLPVNAVTVEAGAGDDTFNVSGNGANRIVFGVGSGHDVLDNPGNGYQRGDVLDLTALLPSDVSLSRSGNQLIVKVLATGETFTTLWQFYGDGVSFGVGSIKFADGSVWDRTAIAANAWVRGTSGNDSLTLPATGVTVDAGAGDDTITVSGNGSDRIVFAKGYGHDTLTNPGSGYNRDDTLVLKDINPWEVQFGRSGDAMTLSVPSTGDSFRVNFQYWGDGSQIQGLTHIQFANGSNWSRSNLADATSTFTWVGSTTNAALTGNDYGANIFQFGAGAESAYGGARNNVYQVTASTGQAQINLSSATGANNEIDFLSSITDQNLWFEQTGNDLKIDLLGTSTSTTISNWFSGSAGALQEITAGGLKIDSQISQLVQAMATYSANNTGFDPTSSSIHTLPNDTTLQGAVSAAWHA